LKKPTIILFGGLMDSKWEKVVAGFKEELKKAHLEAEIVCQNAYVSKTMISDETENADVMITVGTNAPETKLPVISGLCLAYPWIGTQKLIDELKTLEAFK
jgi:predicted TIM-barrel enzyme